MLTARFDSQTNVSQRIGRLCEKALATLPPLTTGVAEVVKRFLAPPAIFVYFFLHFFRGSGGGDTHSEMRFLTVKVQSEAASTGNDPLQEIIRSHQTYKNNDFPKHNIEDKKTLLCSVSYRKPFWFGPR